MNPKASKKTSHPHPKPKNTLKHNPTSKSKTTKTRTLKEEDLKSLFNRTKRQPQTPSTGRRLISSALNYLTERGDIQPRRMRPESSSETKHYMKCRISMKELVTEEDVITMSDDEDFEESYSCVVNRSQEYSLVSENKAAILIQKMWKGYKTRGSIKIHLEGHTKTHTLKKDENLEKTHKLLHNRKKSNLDEGIDLTATKHLAELGLGDLLRTGSDCSPLDRPIKTEMMKNGKISRRMQEQLDKLKRQQAQKWREIIELIQYIPTQDIQGSSLLKTLITKSQENKLELEIAEATVLLESTPNLFHPSSDLIITPSAPQIIINQHKFTDPLSDRTDPSSHQDHPFIRIIELQIKMMKDRLQIELKRLDKRLRCSSITKEVYQQKRDQLMKEFEMEERDVLSNKSQINFSLEKAHDAIISSKRDASFLYRATGRETPLRHSISDQNVLLNSFIKQRVFIDQELMSCNSTQSLKIKRTVTQLQFLSSPSANIDEIEANIHTSQLDLEETDRTKQMDSMRETVEYIQKKAEEHLVDEICLEIYLSDGMSTAFMPFFELHNSYKFRKVTQVDIQQFLKTLNSSPFRPTKQELLKRLNQKINPTAKELLRILRNQEPEEDEDDEFYELIVPEATFKQFREWKESSIVGDLLLPPAIKNPIDVLCLSQQNTLKFQEREQSARARKKKLLKFEKDLQAMYYKAVFNCFNEAVIEVKCSYSPLSGRSTIGPGELRVSLLDTNLPVSLTEVDSIVEKGKNKVMQNFKYKCPALDTSSYSSLNRFQDALMSQIQQEFNLSQHKWVSFFDEYLEIAMELTVIISEQLYMEATKEIFKMQLCRI